MRWPADEPWSHCSDPLPDGSLGQAPLGVAQFYRRDFPTLPFPTDRDLLQLFWCPAVHDDTLVHEEAVPHHASALRPCQTTEYPHSYDAEELGFEPGDDWPQLAPSRKSAAGSPGGKPAR
ncbi:hypothetical protein GCM10023148_00070 [Actinokineospora soli]